MKGHFRKLTAAFMLLAMLVTAIPAAAHAEGGLLVTSYESSATSIQKGGVVDLTIHLKNTEMKTSDVSSVESIDVSRLVDSFTGGTKTVTINSSGEDPLEFTVAYTGLTYSGSGKSFKLSVGVAGGNYQNVEVGITQAVEYEAPRVDNTPDPPSSNPQPMVQVSRNDISSPIEAGQEFKVKVTFKNLGTQMIKTPVAVFTASEGLQIMDSVSSYTMSDIKIKDTASVEVKLRANDTIASAAQTLSVDLKFNYNSGSGMTQGSISDKINIPAKVKTKDSIPQPTVIVTRSPIKGPVSSGQEVPVTVSFKNAGKTALVSPVAVFSTTDSLTITDDTSTYILNDIPAGDSRSVTVKVKAGKDISSTTQSVNVELKYSYDSGDTMANGSTSDKVNLSMNASTGGSNPTPNIIVSAFDYGGGPVAAGGKFPLTFKFKNTSSTTAVENIVATVETSESFTMDGTSNTYYYSKLAAGGTQSQKISMQALPAAKTGAQTATVSFKYEYVEEGKRTSGTASVVLSIPIYQPDRFEITPPAVPATANANEEMTLSLNYVNKGKSEVANVTAAIVYDDESVSTLVPTQNLGNFESGKSGSIGFALTPIKAGAVDFTLKVSYEDANQQVQTREYPVHLTAEEPVVPEEEFPEEEQPAGGGNKMLIGAIGAAVIAAVIGAVLFIRRRKKKKTDSEENSDWDNWEEESEDDEAPNGGEKE